MTQTGVMVIVAVGTFLASIGGSLFIAGSLWGGVRTRLDILEKQLPTLATREQLAGVKEDLAEIKGMFRMVPRDGHDSSMAAGGQ